MWTAGRLEGWERFRIKRMNLFFRRKLVDQEMENRMAEAVLDIDSIKETKNHQEWTRDNLSIGFCQML